MIQDGVLELSRLGWSDHFITKPAENRSGWLSISARRNRLVAPRPAKSCSPRHAQICQSIRSAVIGCVEPATQASWNSGTDSPGSTNHAITPLKRMRVVQVPVGLD